MTAAGAENVRRDAKVSGGMVIGHDGSTGAQEALCWGLALAARAEMAVTVVRAWQVATAPRPADSIAGYVPPMRDWETAVQAALEQHVARARPPEGVDVSCQVAHAAAATVLVGASRDAELVVVGARGMGGFLELVLGSVSDQLVRHAHCPVTVVRSGSTTPKTPSGGGA